MLELILALSITALVGLGIASMFTAVGYGTDADRDMRELVVSSKLLTHRINTSIRNAGQVLASDDHVIVLWIYDANDDGEPSLHEIEQLEWEPATGRFIRYRAAEDAADVPYNQSQDFLAITDDLKGSAAFPAEVWSRQVTDWSIAFDHADHTQARLITHRLTLIHGQVSETIIQAASLRN